MVIGKYEFSVQVFVCANEKWRFIEKQELKKRKNVRQKCRIMIS